MNHILITGGTGVLGSSLAPRFLADANTRVTLLLRASSEANLADRVHQLQDFWGMEVANAPWLERLEAVAGDVTATHLGLESRKYSELTRKLTHIVHAAGNVRLNQPLDAARAQAVTSAQHILDLSRQASDLGQFQKLEFVSTVGVAGRHQGVVSEQRMAGERNLGDFHNTYEAAKWEAERLVWSAIDEGLPVTLHRPSMIVGDSRTGRILQFQVFYFLTDFLLGKQSLGIVPNFGEAQLDVIPVDYVADAITRSAVENLGTGRVFHLCSGPQPDESWPLNRLVDELRSLAEQRGFRLPRLKRFSPTKFRRILPKVEAVSPAESRRFLRGLPYLLDYLDERQVFDNTDTSKMLADRGLHVPSVAQYLDVVMHAYWNTHESHGESN